MTQNMCRGETEEDAVTLFALGIKAWQSKQETTLSNLGRLVLAFGFFLVSNSALATKPITVLTNEHFKYGTYIIDKPGVYVLGEDISFNPNSPKTLTKAIKNGILPPGIATSLGLPFPVDAFHAGFPLPTQFSSGPVDFAPGGPLAPVYDPAAYGIGFFAAIAVQASNVVIDLKGHKIEQSAEHALLQRFFAVIELADQPFLGGQGPHGFGPTLVPAKNVTIRNGTIGRSAHHGVHGNANQNIKIVDVDFLDYEVAAVALNGVKGLTVKNSTAINRKDVPIVGTFSSAQFIKPYLSELYRNHSQTTLRVGTEMLTVAEVHERLMQAVNRVHRDVIVKPYRVDGRAQINPSAHPIEYAIFHNPFGVIDGNSYSFLTNQLGVAVNGFPMRPDGLERIPSRNVRLANIRVVDQFAFINEVVSLSQNGKPVIDPVGSVFQVRNLHPDTGAPVTISHDERYVGNPVANAQAIVAKAFYNGEFQNSRLDLTRLNITPNVLAWVESRQGFETLAHLVANDGYLCNGDSMFHVNKGVIGFKLDAAVNVKVQNSSVDGLVNLGGVGSQLCGDYLKGKSHPEATLLGYGGAKARGFTFAGSRKVNVTGALVSRVEAVAGTAIGIDVMTNARNVTISRSKVYGVKAGLGGGNNYTGPNEVPTAIGVRIGGSVRKVKIQGVCVRRLRGFDGQFDVNDESGSAKLFPGCGRNIRPWFKPVRFSD